MGLCVERGTACVHIHVCACCLKPDVVWVLTAWKSLAERLCISGGFCTAGAPASDCHDSAVDSGFAESVACGLLQ